MIRKELVLSFDFVADHLAPVWQEIRYGLERQWLSRRDAIALAVRLMSEGSEDSDVIELASLTHKDPVDHLVEALAEKEESLSEDCIRQTWLYLLLAWVLSHREEFDDPLQIVEQIYAEFRYPDAIRSFVRYMPMDGPDLGREANEQRLFDRWSQYVAAERRRRQKAQPCELDPETKSSC